MSEPEFNWPKRGDEAFARSCPRGPLKPSEVFVMPDEGAYLAGFQRAADMIVEAAHKEDWSADHLFFPVAYLYRHHLELMLKELVGLGIEQGRIRVCETILKQHDLKRLWEAARRLIAETWPDAPRKEVEATEAAEHVILEFHKLDPRGEAFRYARDKKGAPHLVGAPPVVDLGALKAVVDGVSRYLDASYAGIEASAPGAL